MEAQRGDKIESYLPKRMGGLPIAGVAAADIKVLYEPKPDGTGNYRNDVVDLYQLGADGHTITMMANVVLQFCVPRIGPARSEENPRTISIKGDMVPGIPDRAGIRASRHVVHPGIVLPDGRQLQ